MTGEAPGRRRAGRPAGGADERGDAGGTRDGILAVARAEFGERGYDATSVRGIARLAGVDPALVHHYFGTKDGLFVAAMRLPIDPTAILPAVLAGGPDGLGERLVRFFLSVWEPPANREPLLAVLRSASTNDTAAAMMRGFLQHAIVARIAASLPVPDARRRVAAAASQLLGLVMARYVLRLEPLASASEEEVVALLGPTIQRYLAGDLGAPS